MVREFANIDRVIDWGLVWGERRKAAAAEIAAAVNGDAFNGTGYNFSIDEIEQIVRDGPPPGANRSDVFHSIVGHYLGCNWSAEKILEHLRQFPNGIGGRYLREGRLHKEIARSAGKYAAARLPLVGSDGWVNGWEAKAPQLEILGQGQSTPEPEPEQEEPSPDGGLDADSDLDEQPPQDLQLPRSYVPEPAILKQEQGEPLPEQREEESELEDDNPDEGDLDGEHPRDPKLPPLYTHGDPDARPPENWLVKHLIPARGHGLLSGQWGAGKTFVMFDLASALMIGQPFLGHAIKRQCGVLLIAPEGADQVRLRLEAVVREKCGDMRRAPFCWYETAPMLLHQGSAEKLIAMARQAEHTLQREFGLPLGLIAIDTIAACAGYARAGDENDAAVGQAVMNILKTLAQALNCFALGVEHFGKNLEAGTRGASSKESAADLVIACLGDKELSGNVVNTRLAVRKNRGGRQGQEYPFALRIVKAPEPDEDGEPVTTMVVDWQAAPAGDTSAQPDPWQQCRRRDQQTAILRLKRILMSILAEKGVELPIPPDGPVVRMIDQEIVREQFYVQTPAEGTPEQKGRFRRQRYLSALDWAEQKRLIGVVEIGGLTYLYLLNPQEEAGEGSD
jgi:AAA domain